MQRALREFPHMRGSQSTDSSWSRDMMEAMVAILRVREASLASKGTFILATRHKLTNQYKMFYRPVKWKEQNKETVIPWGLGMATID